MFTISKFIFIQMEAMNHQGHARQAVSAELASDVAMVNVWPTKQNMSAMEMTTVEMGQVLI